MASMRWLVDWGKSGSKLGSQTAWVRWSRAPEVKFYRMKPGIKTFELQALSLLMVTRRVKAD
jgi:hypothetical protein